MLQFTIFGSLDAASYVSSPSAVWAQWSEKLCSPSTKTKVSGLPLIGFYSLKNPKIPRCDDNIDKIYALALDYEETFGPVPTLDEFELPFEYLIYSTPSYLINKPRFRVIIPLSEAITTKDLAKAFSEVLQWVPWSGLDPSCADISRSYYVYSSAPIGHFVHKQDKKNLFFAPLLIDTQEFDRWQKSARVFSKGTVKSIGIGGRNDTLKLQACAAIGLGKSLEEVAQELVEYDSSYHNPALFDDPNEPNYRDGPTAFKRAMAFIRRVTKKVLVPDIRVIEQCTANLVEKEQLFSSSAPTSGTMPDSLFTEAPPLVSELAQFIFECSYSQNIAYCLACAISILSMFKRTRFKCGELYPNLYIALVGDTSSGKSSTSATARYIIQKLGISDNCIGTPFSASGLGRALESHQGEGYWFWEEFGNHLEASVSRNAQSHEKGMLGELNRLYDRAGQEYKMNQYAAEKTKPTILQRAFLSVLATGTTGEVQKLISGSSVSSGFFPRWLLVSPQDSSGHQLQSRRPDRLPLSLTSKLGRLEAIFPNWMDFKTVIDIGFEPQAAQVALEFKLETQENPALWGKFMENSTKIALTVCEGTKVSLSDLTFGMLFTKHCIEFAEKLFIHQTALTEAIPLLRRDTQTIFDKALLLFRKNPEVWITIEQFGSTLGLSYKPSRKYLQILMASGKVSERNELCGQIGAPKKSYKLL